VKVAYQGAPGAFGHEAALRFAPAHEPVACPTFAAALDMVAAGSADAAILPGSSLETVTIAVSHIMALRQCAWTLSRLGLGTEEAPNTAIAARDLVDSHKAALASAAAAEIYGLNILQENLQDEPGNATRFVLISR
jgi:prephenate dehydratase